MRARLFDSKAQLSGVPSPAAPRRLRASIASASLLTEKMKGRAVGELKEMRAAEIAGELGGLPPASFHAAQLAEDGVRAILQKI